MPQRTNAFQRLVTLLTASLADKARVTESAMLPDRVTGEMREVDILVSAHAGGYAFQLGIEVVSWARPADTPWIEKMRAKHENLPTDKLVLVSAAGFSKPALAKALFYGIEALSLEQASEADWPLVASLTATGVFEVLTIKFDVDGVLLRDDGSKEKLNIPLAASFPTRNGRMTIDQFVRSVLDRGDVRDLLREHAKENEPHEFWFSYTEPGGLWRCEDPGRVGQFVELRVGLRVLNATTPVRYATGKFRAVPFVSGASLSERPLNFVLTRARDGTCSGYVLDESGVRTLKSQQVPE